MKGVTSAALEKPFSGGLPSSFQPDRLVELTLILEISLSPPARYGKGVHRER